ncbi:Daunorubicin/doxorubicin resistance ATP-binding protein DrrA [uncultured Eubacterium sp.]|nr:Daunorubicin/doxorubicin resistance ATP-binding protein DrrA [uncultured Eubacterium sp.]
MGYENAIELKNVTKEFKGFKLDNISFDLPKGCILGLVGENGAGKSTTINLIMNALKSDSGEISVMGVDNRSEDFAKLKEDIGVVLDEAYFPIVINAEVVNKMMKATYTRWDENVFFDYIHRFDLPLKKQFKEFSRGMKMKLAIAVALSHDPKLLVLDEATSGLDPIVRDEILEIFYDFTRDPEHSVLISSHILSDLEKLCDYVAFIHKGKLLFCEGKDELLEKYGVVRCARSQLADIPPGAVKGKRISEYGAECLVERNLVSSSFNIEKASVEDIILYMVKGDK